MKEFKLTHANHQSIQQAKRYMKTCSTQLINQFSCSVMSNSLQPHEFHACDAPLFITSSWNLLKLMSIELMTMSNHFILCHPLLVLPSIFSSISVFSHESILPNRWSKYWSFSFSISFSNEHSGLISFRMDLLDLFAVQRTLKSLLKHHSYKASVLQCSAFFIFIYFF